MFLPLPSPSHEHSPDQSHTSTLPWLAPESPTKTKRAVQVLTVREKNFRTSAPYCCATCPAWWGRALTQSLKNWEWGKATTLQFVPEHLLGRLTRGLAEGTHLGCHPPGAEPRSPGSQL